MVGNCQPIDVEGLYKVPNNISLLLQLSFRAHKKSHESVSNTYTSIFPSINSLLAKDIVRFDKFHGLVIIFTLKSLVIMQGRKEQKQVAIKHKTMIYTAVRYFALEIDRI